VAEPIATVKRGHWTKGKRRNNPRGWKVLLALLKRYVRERASGRKTAVAIGVSDRTLRRWISGEDVAGEEHAAQLRELLAGIKR